MKIFKYTIIIYKDLDPYQFRKQKVKDFKNQAEEGLIKAEMTLELQEHLLLKKEEIGYNEAEIKGVEDAINNGKKSIANFQTQLEVINNWK